MTSVISLVAAASENNVLGKKGEIPWDLPKDFKHFHDATQGHPIIMGRKTHESIGRVLPGRKNIIVTRSEEYSSAGCEITHSIEDALALVKDDPSGKICVIGGGEIYKLALPYATELDLTRVHTEIEGGDAFFPEFSDDEWEEVSRERHETDERHAIAYTFLLYKRKEG